MDEHLYLVAYDIHDDRRWRQVFRIMNGHGDWLQYSVVQCRLSRKRHAELVAQLDVAIKHSEDHILIIDLGPADKVAPRVMSLGKAFAVVSREPVIV